jgi:hypothetical protein
MVSGNLILSLVVLGSTTSTLAAPIPIFGSIVDKVKGLFNGPGNTAATTTFKAEETQPLSRIAQFARASFCTAPVVSAWKCGAACEANPETQTLLAGGDDGKIPGFYVAFDPPTNSIVVAHQGTTKKNILSVINDLDIRLVQAPENRFPGSTEAKAKVHAGFLATFERTADQIMATVKQGIAEKGAKNVIVTGHSLGSAVGMLDYMSLRQSLPADVTVQSMLFGLPRVGNSAWADWVDKPTRPGDKFNFVVNGADPVPKIPPVELAYRHPSGEIFQRNSTSGVIDTLNCPGQENENCSTGISVLDSNTDFHKGSYAGVFLGSKFCAT